jgi:hypothetical protein
VFDLDIFFIALFSQGFQTSLKPQQTFPVKRNNVQKNNLLIRKSNFNQAHKAAQIFICVVWFARQNALIYAWR